MELFPPKMPVLCRVCMTIICLYDNTDRKETAQVLRLVRGLTCRTCGHVVGEVTKFPDEGHRFPLSGKVIHWWLQPQWTRRPGARCSRCSGAFYADELEGGLCCWCRSEGS